MKFSTRLAGLGLIATAFVSMPARAQLTSAGLDCHNGNAVSLMGAIACAGAFNGNNMNQQAAVTATMKNAFQSYTNSGAGSWWSYVGDPGFTGSTQGGVTFTSPVTGYFSIVLKSSNQFSMYLFNGGTTGISSISFTDIGTSLNKKNVVQGLSHASLYALNGPPPVTSTPEPSTIVLMASGLAGIVAFRRRRSA